MKLLKRGLLICFAVLASSAVINDAHAAGKKKMIKTSVAGSVAQYEKMLEVVGEPTGKNFPRTLVPVDPRKPDAVLSAYGEDEYKLSVVSGPDWTSGFFPGSLWYLYELTGEQKWKDEAEKWTWALEPQKDFTGNHDIGFIMYCSFGNAQRLAPKPEYNPILIHSANTALKRYDPQMGVIKSWNEFHPWSRGGVVHQYPVIIDNMMNLELLFYASKLTGDKKFYEVAISHADKTLANHFRDDFSTYHVVAYDQNRQAFDFRTAQGYSDNSTWSRGQAWAIYGFTMCYRETGEQRYLDAATKAADWWLANIPEDYVPYWDFNVGQPGYTPDKYSFATQYKEKTRDASAAAITCSALFELGQLTKDRKYTKAAIKTLQSLSSPAYLAEADDNGNFIIKHCTGSAAGKVEIDVPLNYADYYYLESLSRYRKLK